MATTPTTNKAYDKPTPGTESGAWGGVLNNQVFTYVDSNMGGILALSLSSSNVSLTTAQARNVIIQCTGTLSANVQITSAAKGFYIAENLCTGAFTVTVTNGVNSVTLPANYRVTIFADATNGVRIVAIGNRGTGGLNYSRDAFPAGATALFLQSAVPTGWTLNTTYANYLLRLSSSAGAVTGGSVAVDTLFARTTVDGHALTTAQIAAHPHGSGNLNSTNFGSSATTAWLAYSSSTGSNAVATSSSTGGGNPHDHTLDLRATRITTLMGVRNT